MDCVGLAVVVDSGHHASSSHVRSPQISQRDAGYSCTPDDGPALAAAAAIDPGTYDLTPVPESEQGAIRYIEAALEQQSNGWRLPLTTEFNGHVVGSTSFLAPDIWAWPAGSKHQRVDVRNVRSRRAIERLGAQLEGVRRADLPGTDDTVRDSAYYSIMASEWPQSKQALQARIP